MNDKELYDVDLKTLREMKEEELSNTSEKELLMDIKELLQKIIHKMNYGLK